MEEDTVRRHNPKDADPWTLIHEIKDCFKKFPFHPSTNLEREIGRLLFDLARIQGKIVGEIIGENPTPSDLSPWATHIKFPFVAFKAVSGLTFQPT